MLEILINFSLFILGCILLYYSSDFLINQSALISKKLKLSPIIIGATVIAIGTSLPELLVSLYSMFLLDGQESSSIIVGNVLGSNIANISLVLGVCVLFHKMIFQTNIFKELLFIFFLGLYAIGCLYYEININQFHGITLLLLFCFYLYYLVVSNKIEKFEEDFIPINWLYTIFILLLSIIGLALGTDLVLRNAINISKILGFNELTISITIIALGTSLPELFSSMIAIKNKHYNLLIGNIIGSNVINIVFVLGFSSLFTKSGIHIDTSAIMLKGSSITIGHILPYIIIVFILSHIMLIAYYLFKKSMSRIEGLLFVVLYVLFLYSLFQI